MSSRRRQVVTMHKGVCLSLVMGVELTLCTISAVVIINYFSFFTSNKLKLNIFSLIIRVDYKK